jgi:hypothetical protein
MVSCGSTSNRAHQAEMKTLGDQLDAWKKWSVAADRSEWGWESDFPQWSKMIEAARAVMLERDHDRVTMEMLAECWSLSEEDEELLDVARDRLDECLPVLEELAKSSWPACRWQVYAALAAPDPRGEAILRQGAT